MARHPFPPVPLPGSRVSSSWMRRFLDAARASVPIAGPGIRASYTPNGVILSAAAGMAAPASSGTAPFAVRWHQPAAGTAGQWEIYLPSGCVSLGRSCGVLNAPASDTSGHASEAGWYLLPFGGSPAAGDRYRVIVHCKRRAIAEDDLPDEGDPEVSPMVLAWMHSIGEADGHNVAYAGDEQSFNAADIEYSAVEGGEPAATVTQHADRAVYYTGSQDAEFDLWWAFDAAGTTALAVSEMGLLRRTLSTGTDVATIADPPDVTGATQGIFLRVRNTGQATELAAVLDAENTTAGVDYFLVQLYAVDQWHRASDFRSALWRLPMYLGGGVT